MKKIEICPSILSADFLNLKESLNLLEQKNVKILHFDVMDGNFVPNISFGEAVLKSIKKNTNLLLDVHLMVLNPLKFVDMFSNAGAFSITFHIESKDSVLECIKKIKSLNCKCAIAINPKTPVEKILPYLNLLDMVVVMGVNPGFGGQKLIKNSLATLKQLRQKSSLINLELDGGINLKNAKKVVEAGANWLVLGSFIFSSNNILNSIELLKKEIYF